MHDELGVSRQIPGIKAFRILYRKSLEYRIGIELLSGIRTRDDRSPRGEYLGECRHACALDADEMDPVAPEGFR
jgi:hypothetical protein